MGKLYKKEELEDDTDNKHRWYLSVHRSHSLKELIPMQVFYSMNVL